MIKLSTSPTLPPGTDKDDGDEDAGGQATGGQDGGNESNNRSSLSRPALSKDARTISSVSSLPVTRSRERLYMGGVQDPVLPPPGIGGSLEGGSLSQNHQVHSMTTVAQ